MNLNNEKCSCFSSLSVSPKLPLKVIIVGAGAAGLVTLKEFLKSPDLFDVICFEGQGKVGGLWNYQYMEKEQIMGKNIYKKKSEDWRENQEQKIEKAEPYLSAVYKHLKTNLPHQTMQFRNMPFPQVLKKLNPVDEEKKMEENEKSMNSFIDHWTVSRYLHNCASLWNLYPHIKLNTLVTQIKLNPDYYFDNHNDKEWIVEVEKKKGEKKRNQNEEMKADLVIICNGHFEKPIFPEIKGIEKFNGTVFHSQYYREGCWLENKNVLVVGGGPSGVDIVQGICPFAKKVILSHKWGQKLPLNEKVKQVGEITEINDLNEIKTERLEKSEKKKKKDDFFHGVLEKEVEVKKEKNEEKLKEIEEKKGKDVEEIIRDIDCIILCTGFSFSIPFLLNTDINNVSYNEKNNNNNTILDIKPCFVSPLYKDLISLKRPTLSLVGLPSRILPFLLFEIQASFLRYFYSDYFLFSSDKNRRKKLIKKMEKENEEYEENKEKEGGYGMVYGKFQWIYMKDLLDYSGQPSLHPSLCQLYNMVSKARSDSLFDYKNINFHFDSKLMSYFQDNGKNKEKNIETNNIEDRHKNSEKIKIYSLF